MKKFVCSVCGYVYEGEAAPAECPICHAPAEKFKEQAGEKTWAAEHVAVSYTHLCRETTVSPTSRNGP